MGQEKLLSPLLRVVVLQLLTVWSGTDGLVSIVNKETNTVVKKLRCDVPPQIGYDKSFKMTGSIILASPVNACDFVSPPTLSDENPVLLTSRSGCDFSTKLKNAQRSGYAAVIIYNENSNSSHPMPIFKTLFDEYLIFSCFTGQYIGLLLQNNFTLENGYIVQLSDDDMEVNWWFIFIMALIVAVCLMVFVLCFKMAWYFSSICWTRMTTLHEDFRRFARERRRSKRNKLFASALKQVLPQRWNPNQLSESCAICVEEFHVDEELRILNCSHGFHISCIDEWLINGRRDCPVCKRKVILENHDLFSNTDSDTDDETAPLLSNSHSSHGQYGNVSSIPSQRRANPFLRGNFLNIQQDNPDEERANENT